MICLYPNSRFNGVVEMTIYPERWRVEGEAFRAWESAKRVPEQKRLTWFYPDFGSHVPKEHITPEQLAAAARGVER